MIPDDEPWWMVRRLMQADQMPSDAHLDHRDDIPEPTDFRPIGYEW